MKNEKLKYKGEIGKYLPYTGCTITQQRKWPKEEEEFLMEKVKSHTLKEIAICLGRTYQSVHLKHKRLNKKPIGNNTPNIIGKHETNDMFIRKLNPKSILDLFAGNQSYYDRYENIKVVSNDRYNQNNTYNEDARDLLLSLNFYKEKFDIVDIDPFGGAFDYIELSLMIANKGIIITYGEFGQKRYKRIDYVEHRYNIDTLKKFNIDKIIKETCKLGLRHKKKLTPIKILDSRKMIYRVYYKITPTPKTPTSKNNKL